MLGYFFFHVCQGLVVQLARMDLQWLRPALLLLHAFCLCYLFSSLRRNSFIEFVASTSVTAAKPNALCLFYALSLCYADDAVPPQPLSNTTMFYISILPLNRSRFPSSETYFVSDPWTFKNILPISSRYLECKASGFLPGKMTAKVPISATVLFPKGAQ